MLSFMIPSLRDLLMPPFPVKSWLEEFTLNSPNLKKQIMKRSLFPPLLKQTEGVTDRTQELFQSKSLSNYIYIRPKFQPFSQGHKYPDEINVLRGSPNRLLRVEAPWHFFPPSPHVLGPGPGLGYLGIGLPASMDFTLGKMACTVFFTSSVFKYT